MNMEYSRKYTYRRSKGYRLSARYRICDRKLHTATHRHIHGAHATTWVNRLVR